MSRMPEDAVACGLSPQRHSAEDVIRSLALEPLPHEGGWFRRIVTGPAGSSRAAYASIYALFTPDHFSALHRVDVDEVWTFLAGDAIEVMQLTRLRQLARQFDDFRRDELRKYLVQRGGESERACRPDLPPIVRGARLVHSRACT
jgi:predicted cupin superfamily sugar epimerase